jgi:hypothetical protein
MMVKGWIAVLVMWAIGAASFTLLCSEPRRWVLAAKLGLSFGIGLAVLTLTLFIASLCGVKPAPWVGLSELILLWAIVLVAKRKQLSEWLNRSESADQITQRSWLRAMEIALSIFVVGILLVVSAVTLLEPVVEWDVMGIWALKGKVLLHDPVILSDYFRDLSKAYSHLDYPLLWPMAMAWIWRLTGDTDVAVVKVLAVGLLVSFSLTCFGLLRRKHSRAVAILFTALLAAAPILLSQTSRLMADPTLAFFVFGAFVCAYFWVDSGHRDDLRIAAAFATGMLFTKNEGIGLWLILLFVVGICVITRRQLQRLFPAVAWLGIAPLLATGAWFVFRSGIAKAHEDYGGKINPAYFFQNISRLPEVLSGWGNVFCDWYDWLIFWPLALMILIVAPTKCLRRPVVFLLLAATLPLLLYTYIYVVTPWNLKELMEATANRLLLQVMPLWLFLLAEKVRTSNLLPFLQAESAA